MRNRALAGQQIQNYNNAQQHWTDLAGLGIMAGGNAGVNSGFLGALGKNRNSGNVPAHLR